jgi:pyochelin synthetase
VADAAVVVQRPPAGGTAQLAAYVVPHPLEQADEQALRRFLGERLPRYMVPTLFALVPALPLSRNGKLDRAALQPIQPVQQRGADQGQGPCLPRDATEARLHALWTQVLGHDRFGVGDDFFAVGGQSFEGVRLAGLIKDVFGTRLSLGDIWQHRSIAEQAHLTRAGSAGNAALHVLASRGGEAPPLFLVHPAGGQVMCYRHLAALLKRDVYGFEARLGDGGVSPDASVQDMAAHYLEQLQARHPQGPVLLGGWSSGGPIAFEMAAQMRTAGRAVDGVVIIDSPAPTQLPAVDRTEMLAWFAEDLSLEPAGLALHGAAAGAADHTAELQVLAQSLAAAGRQMPATVDQLVPVYRVFDTVVRANRRYRAPVIDVDLLVLRAREGSVSEFALHPHHTDPAWGWPLHTSRRASWKHVAGTHHTVLTPSGAGACADAIEAWIAGYR